MPSYADRILVKLQQAFNPEKLEIQDESHRHAGHAGHNPAGETHFKILVVASYFEGLSRIERHKKIYTELTEEMSERVHALVITARTPQEDMADAARGAE